MDERAVNAPGCARRPGIQGERLASHPADEEISEGIIQTPHGVLLLSVDLKNATPGVHGLHIHETGRCDRPSFESAGGHFNPSKRQHGFYNPDGPHAGDLANIEVPSSGEHSVAYFAPDLSVASGAGSLLDGDGAAIVIHAGQDDYSTDPAGDAGDRLACGPIVRSDK